MAVAGANRHDMKLVRPTIDGIIIDRPEPTDERPQGMCLDKGYDYTEVREILKEFGFTAHIRARGEEAKALKTEAGFRARRWVVELLHAGLPELEEHLRFHPLLEPIMRGRVGAQVGLIQGLPLATGA